MLTQAEARRALAGGIVALTLVIAITALPVLALLAFASRFPENSGFDAYTFSLLRFTLLQAVLSTLLSILIAIPVTLALCRRPHFPGRLWIIRLMAVPMGLPVLAGALGLITVFGRQGIVNQALLALGLEQPLSIYGLTGILIAHVFFNFPLACRLMIAVLEGLPQEYWRLGASLGMRSWSIFRFIELPALLRAIPGAAGLIFMLCATSFTLVLVLGGGPAATTLEVAIYQSLRLDFDPARAIAMALLQILVTACILALLSRLPANDPMNMGEGRRISRMDGQSWPARIWDTGVIMCACLFLSLPLLAIAWAGLRSNFLEIVTSAIFLQALSTSLAIAMLSAFACVLLALVIAFARQVVAERRAPPRSARIFSASLGSLSSLVLLVPPVVLGTGWFLILREIGEVSRFSIPIIIVINMLMALPFVMRVLQPALQSHRARTARLVASLGITGFSRWRIVDWRVLGQPLAMAFSFAMALSLGDLGAVAMFGSQDLVTLPWLLYSSLGSYRSHDADSLALILGLICLGLTLIGTAEREMRP
ncbi:thiamine/thiamine pyrophosphate ABC transporter permease [Rhizobium oryzicola]|uniref:Thiamine transport system permease protein ThiP n=1 Tax=Rhizobium oryzicola TaxID=1232668 RepID=A0ABT8T737_9HYPH|nr:thiamine/thiamine pyrophosphate ABC transporter permease [Rhizobium oryzicola]MDO1585187.1 thiamine/thiamine pyrophosphate ABC transporter permease [Rhizobium oryzicola]